MGVTVATWMYTVPDGDGAVHFQVGKRSDNQAARNFYWRCLFCLFASAKAHMPDCRCVLFYNDPPPRQIDGKDTAELIERLQVELVPFQTVTRPPMDYHPAWNTQFIVLDALDQLAQMSDPEDAVLLLDGDCVFVRPLEERELSKLRAQRALLYTLDHGPDEEVNGLSTVQLTQLAKTYEPPAETSPVLYSGGEFVCLSGGALGEVAGLARAAYEQSLARHRLGREKFREEAHLLSYVYSVLGFENYSGNELIKRLWTDRATYCNVDGSEQQLAIWHLPAEKKRGFVRAFKALGNSAAERALFLDSERLATLFRVNPGRRSSAKMGLRRWVRVAAKPIRRWLRSA